MKTARGHTLLESIIALGFVAVVMMALVAVLPVGMNHLAAEGGRVAEERILQHVEARCAQSVPAGEFFFSTDGAPLEQAEGAAYAVSLETAPEAALPGDVAGSLMHVKVSIRRLHARRASEHSLLLAPALHSSAL